MRDRMGTTVALGCVLLLGSGVLQASSISIERWQTDRQVAIGQGTEESYSAYYNAISLAHAFERSETESLGVKVRLFQESSDEITNGQGFDVTGVALEGSRQFMNPTGLLLEAILGFSYRKYEVPTYDGVEYFGVSLGGAFAYPVITNKVFVGGAANYQLLKDTENSEARDGGYQLSGIRADLGVIYAYQAISVRLGYRIRDFNTSSETVLALEDKARGIFLSASISF